MQIQNKRYVLSIAYNNYQTGIGGVDKAVIAQKEKLYQNQISYVFIFPQLARIKKHYILAHLWEVIADDKNYGLYTTKELLNELSELQHKQFQLQSITIHHLLNMYFPDLYLLLDHIKGKIYMLIHDYYTICPQCFLLKNNETFCGKEGYQKDKCKDCRNYPDVEIHVQRIKQLFQRYMERIQLIFPSEYTRQLWSTVYPKIKSDKKVIFHQTLNGEYKENMEEIKKEDVIKIAYIGQQLYLKGWDIWKKLYSGKKLEKGYQSYYLGMGKETGYVNHMVKVSFQKEGKNAMLKKLRNQKIDCVILWSIWPETYSYTYYECLAANAFVITNTVSGNIAAMVQKNGNGKVLGTIKELEELIGNPEELKQLINQWRVQKKYGAETLQDNRILFETDGANAEIVTRKNQLSESRQRVLYAKILVGTVKWLKKFYIKLCY